MIGHRLDNPPIRAYKFAEWGSGPTKTMTRFIFMTGTVAPAKGTPLLTRAATSDRISDYREALSFYLGVLERGAVDRLVFVENSGHGMAPFEDLVSASSAYDRVDLLSFAAPPVREGESRLCAEFELILHGLAHVESLRTALSGVMWKVTGRYRVINIEQMIARSEPGHDLYLHCRDYPQPYVDFAVAGYALPQAPDLIRGLLAESRIFKDQLSHVRAALREGSMSHLSVSPRMPVIPNFRGRRGADGASYGRLDFRLKYLLRCAAARIAPGVWI